MRAEFLPFSRPTLGEEEIAEVVDSLRSGWITTGPKVARFEAAFRERLGVKHAIAVTSATAGLHLAIASLNLGPEDEVMVPSMTWASTANVVELSGSRTCFVDCDPATLCIDPDDVRRRITPRTRAIVPVHFAGEAADLTQLIALWLVPLLLTLEASPPSSRSCSGSPPAAWSSSFRTRWGLPSLVLGGRPGCAS